MDASAQSGLARLAEVMRSIRRGCPWDAEQTHASLVTYLVEESAELVDAIDSGDDADLREELGDLLLQIFFHAEIAAEQGRFTLDEVASEIADKLVRRHPYVFTDEAVPEDVVASWEQRKRQEKARTSALDGIPASLATLVRATKVIGRARAHGVQLTLPSEPIEPDAVGAGLLSIVSRAHASGVDADAALRAELGHVESHIRAVEEGAKRRHP
ncbi:XTP/dITP diphosphohydrolase [Propioniciclava tarda]|nr:XTP/dITP diphosphohydrolase [Propioniciclava tarda]